jgi:hypothetical protein
MRLRTGFTMTPGFAMTLGIAAFALAGQSVAAGNNNTGPYAPPTYQPKVETPQPPTTYQPQPPTTYQPRVERPAPPVTYQPSGPTFTNRR